MSDHNLNTSSEWQQCLGACCQHTVGQRACPFDQLRAPSLSWGARSADWLRDPLPLTNPRSRASCLQSRAASPTRSFPNRRQGGPLPLTAL